MLDTMEVIYETTYGLVIRTMNIDPRWPWTVLVQWHWNCTSNISKMVTGTIMVSMEVD